jgi:predicted phage terminase large subunit-like protein
VHDNPSIVENDPDYLVRLASLDRVERARLLGGDWMVRGAAGEWFDRSWFDTVPRGPGRLAVSRVRYWDRAGTAAEGGSTDDPDWTVGALVSVDVHGITYVEDVIRFRGPPHVVERRIRETAERDRRDHGDVLVCLEQDPGQAGKFEVDHYIRRTLAGFNVRKRRPQGSKIKRAKPVSAQAEQGTIRLVRGPWIPAFLDELELFPEGHDDQVDALSGAYAVSLTSHAQVAKSIGVNPYSSAQGGY